MAVNRKKLYDAVNAILIASEGRVYFSDPEIEEANIPLRKLSAELKQIIEDDRASIAFPGEVDTNEFTAQEILESFEEITTFRAELSDADAASMLRSDYVTYQVISPTSQKAHDAHWHQIPLRMSWAGVEISIEYEVIAVGVAATIVGAYWHEALGALTQNVVVKAKYKRHADSRRAGDDAKDIDRFLFTLTSEFGITFERSGFVKIRSSDHEDEVMPKKAKYKLPETAEQFNGGIPLFLAASQVADTQLRFFSMYKVLEFFGPIAVKLHAHELLAKRLQQTKSFSPTPELISELHVISIENNPNTRIEENLIFTVLQKGVDLIALDSKLPKYLRGGLTSGSKTSDVERHARKLARAVCATRNQIAHAKSNYTRKDDECPEKELATLTRFVEHAASQAIRWYNRLPQYLQTADVS